MGAGRATTTAVAAVLGSVFAVVLLVTWAASIGPGGVLTGDGPATHRISPTQTTTSAQPSGSPTRIDDGQRLQDSSPRSLNPVVRAIAVAVELATLVLALFLLYRFLRWLRQVYDARRRPDARPEDVPFDVLEAPGVVVREMLHDAESQRAVLAAGAPRNAIVECWHRFETQAAAAGVSKRAWETSSEFALRILELANADPGAVSRLAGLYREARFSAHEMTETQRAEALSALDVIHHGLRAPLARGSL